MAGLQVAAEGKAQEAQVAQHIPQSASQCHLLPMRFLQFKALIHQGLEVSLVPAELITTNTCL